MIRAVLFDKDGTLFDFYRTWAPVTERAALIAAGGDQSRADEIMLKSGKDPVTGRYLPGSLIASGSNRQIVASWVEMLSHGNAEALYTEVEALFLAHQASGGAHPVVALDDLFQRLKARGLKLGVATMDSEAAAHRAMERYGVKQSLDFICGFDTGHGMKPGGGMVEAFVRLVGIPAANVAVVGDSPHDMEMAHAGGAGRAIGVLTGVSPREALIEAGAHLVLESIAELETVL